MMQYYEFVSEEKNKKKRQKKLKKHLDWKAEFIRKYFNQFSLGSEGFAKEWYFFAPGDKDVLAEGLGHPLDLADVLLDGP